jgi:polyhydroxyalkanoate synthesis regulator phasin
MEEAIASAEVDADVARERAAEGERRRTMLETHELEKVPERLDSLVQQGVVTEDEAEKLRELNKVEARVKSGEITETEATEIRNSLMNPKAVTNWNERSGRQSLSPSNTCRSSSR